MLQLQAARPLFRPKVTASIIQRVGLTWSSYSNRNPCCHITMPHVAPHGAICGAFNIHRLAGVCRLVCFENSSFSKVISTVLSSKAVLALNCPIAHCFRYSTDRIPPFPSPARPFSSCLLLYAACCVPAGFWFNIYSARFVGQPKRSYMCIN